jgi:hypothetical protein
VEGSIMARRLGTIIVLAGVLLTATFASAFSMGEVTATTGMQGTLAKSGTMSAKGPIGVVKGSLAQSVATKQGQLASADGAVAWGGGAAPPAGRQPVPATAAG